MMATPRSTRRQTAETAKIARYACLRALGVLRGSISRACCVSIPTLPRKKGAGTAEAVVARPRADVARPPRASMARRAAAIFALALAVRLIHVWQLRASPFFSVLMGDSRGYDDWARQI